jgi:hypothetical protein
MGLFEIILTGISMNVLVEAAHYKAESLTINNIGQRPMNTHLTQKPRRGAINLIIQS